MLKKTKNKAHTLILQSDGGNKQDENTSSTADSEVAGSVGRAAGTGFTGGTGGRGAGAAGSSSRAPVLAISHTGSHTLPCT